MIYTVTLNPALDKTVEIPGFTVDSVNRITAMRTDPGGKGINVSKVIAKLGGRSVAAGILAGAVGRGIQRTLEEAGLETLFQFVPGETRTNLKLVDPVSRSNTDINEPGITVSEAALNALLSELLERVERGDIVVLSGSLPKGAPEHTYYQWAKAFGEKGAKVLLDADGERLRAGLRASPYLIKPNHHELSELTGAALSDPVQLDRAARALMDAWGISRVVVSMGGAGALYVTEKETLYAKGLQVPVGSTVGAGDSMVAALAVARERGLSLEETVRLSMAAGAANVMCSGTQAAEYAAVEALLPRVRYQRLETARRG